MKGNTRGKFMIVEMFLSGFFFLFIIVTNFASNFFGYKTLGKVDVLAKLQDVSADQKKFKISLGLIKFKINIIISDK